MNQRGMTTGFKSTFFYLLFWIILSIQPPAYAQVGDIGVLMTSGSEDAEMLTREYFRPLSSGFGANLNTGWINRVGTHSRFGLDIQIRGGLAFIPSSAESFDILDLNLQRARPADSSNTITPTLGGADRTGPEMIVEDNGDEVARFNLPAGTGLDYIPAPTLQLSVGLLQDTDVMVRYIPKLSLGDYGKYVQYGIGAKHRINSSFPGTLPVDLALMAGYNRVNVTGNPNLNPQPGAIDDPDYSGNYDNQEVSVSFDTFVVQALVGKSLPFLTVYGGLGYQFSHMQVAVKGDYPVPLRGPFGGTRTETVSDPFSYDQDGENTFSGTAGFKIKLGLLDLFADYTLADYPVFNAGIGVSFR